MLGSISIYQKNGMYCIHFYDFMDFKYPKYISESNSKNYLWYCYQHLRVKKSLPGNIRALGIQSKHSRNGNVVIIV